MRIVAAALLMICTAAPALAGPVLWRDIEAGQAEADVRALHPKSKTVAHHSDRIILSEVPITTGCDAKADIKFAEAAVKRVRLNGFGGECGTAVLTALTEKYGTPKVQTADSGATLTRDGDVIVWIADGISIRFQVAVERNKAFGVYYTSKTWEVRYTPVEAATNL